MDPSAIIGGVLGAMVGIYNGYQQKRAADRQYALAQQQYQLAQQQAIEEEQARNKANQKEADVEGLLEKNTSKQESDNLSRGLLKPINLNPLNKKSGLLGSAAF